MGENTNNNDEYIISLKEIFKFFTRNIKSLSYFSIIGLFFTGYSVINAPKIWRGQFQIVIEKNTNSMANSASTGVQALFNKMSSSSNSLNTEVEILKSPFVLLNVYEFLRVYDPSYKESKISFKDWLGQIDVNLKEGTSVLKIIYRDQNKSNIIPVLEKISQKYQAYSGSKRKRDIELSLDYFKSQTEIFKKKSMASNKKSNDFAFKHDLLYFKNNPGSEQNLSSSNSPEKKIGNQPLLNIESNRIEEANKIRKINELIEKIKLNKENPESIIYLSDIINNTFRMNQGIRNTTNDINEINRRLSSLNQIYNENDVLIKDLKQTKIRLAQSLYYETLGNLEAQKESSKANLKALERPPGVIARYKELIRDANKDEMILANLEDQFKVYSLENAKYKEPWQMITNPTLNPSPRPSSKLRKLLFGLISGFSFGALFSIIWEKKENKILSEYDIERILRDIPIETFKLSDKANWDKVVNLLSIGILGSLTGKIKMYLVDIEKDDDIQYLTNLINKEISKLDIKITHSINEAFDQDEFLLCIKSSVSSKDTLHLISQNLVLRNKKIPKIILIDN